MSGNAEQQDNPAALPCCAGPPLSCPGLHLPESSGDPKQVSPAAWLCPCGKCVPVGSVSLWEAWRGGRLRPRHRPGPGRRQRRAGAAWSRRRGDVCSAWRGHGGSSRQHLSAGEGQRSQHGHTRPCHRVPTRGTRTPSLLDSQRPRTLFSK